MENEKDITNIFIAYAPEDAAILEHLSKHLTFLKRSKKVKVWYDGKIIPGQEWAKETDKALNEADIILMLISIDFIVSNFCDNNQMTKALARHKKGEACVIPVIVRSCDWEDAPFSHIQPLPFSATPILNTDWGTKDEPYTEIAKAIKRQIEEQEKIKVEKKAENKKRKKAKKSKKQAKPKARRKQGRVLYRIPNKMQLNVTSLCLIRIAPQEVEEAILKENLKNVDKAVIEDLTKISKFMRVELIDKSGNEAFTIETSNEIEQIVEEDDYTEWQYDITPKMAGSHRLQLMVSVCLVRDELGTGYKNKIILDRHIDIVTEEVKEEVNWGIDKEPLPLMLIHSKGNDDDKPDDEPPIIKMFPKMRSRVKLFSISMLFVLFTPTLWAIAPQFVTPPILYMMYEEHEELSNGRIAIKKDGKWGVVNKWGRQAIEPQYEEIKAYENGVAQVKKDGKWGAIKPNDKNETWLNRVWRPQDKLVVPTVADTILSIDAKTNKVAVKINNKDFWLPMKVTRKVIIDEQTVAKKVAQLPTNLQKTVAIADSLFEIGEIEEAEKALESLETKAIDKVAAKNLNVILEAQKTKWSDKYVEEIYETAEKGETEKLEILEEELNDIEQIEIEIEPIAENGVPKKTIDTTAIVNTPTPTIEEEETKVAETEIEPETENDVEEAIETAVAEQIPEIEEEEIIEAETTTSENNINTPTETADKVAENTATPTSTVEEPKITEAKPTETADKVAENTVITTSTIEEPKVTEAKPTETANKVANNTPTNTSATNNNIPANNNTATSDTEKTDIPEPIQKLLNDMVRVEGGTFRMGCDEQRDGDCEGEEKPVHDVTLSSYEIGKYEVTRAQWQAVMGRNPSYFKDCNNCPVEQVSWNEIQDFLTNLNSMTGKNFRLPSEAEWEYAARGGSKSKGYKYAGSNNIDEVAWYASNSKDKPYEVGSKGKVNELGLYDMSGNIRELCEDLYDANYYKKSDKINPINNNSGTFRVLRNGSWYDRNPKYCRIANRTYCNSRSSINYVGFRLAHGL